MISDWGNIKCFHNNGKLYENYNIDKNGKVCMKMVNLKIESFM